MVENKILQYSKDVLKNIPSSWLELTTHRLDIYEETLAKTQFLEQFELLFNNNNSKTSALSELPTAYDYIRLGHPLSCLLEWVTAHENKIKSESVISFSSKTTPILAILRKNKLSNKNTQILYRDKLPDFFDAQILKQVYGYTFELRKVEELKNISKFNGSTVFISQQDDISKANLVSNVDFFININDYLGSIVLINGEENESYISEIQHVRRRETIAMTPANCLSALKHITEKSSFERTDSNAATNKTSVLQAISGG